MAFKVGSTNFYPGLYQPPTSTAQGTVLGSNGSTTFFVYPGNTTSTPDNSALQYRSLFTHGFVAGGYKGSQPWRNVNKTWHASDITYSVGEQLDRAMAYGDGTFSDFNAYVHGSINAYSGSASHTSSYNLHTGVGRQRGMQTWDYNASSSGAGSYNSVTRPTGVSAGDGVYGGSSVPFGYLGIDPAHDGAGVSYGAAASWSTDGTVLTAAGVGGWDTSTAIDFHGCATDQMSQVGYIFGGGGTTTHRIHFPTEIMYTTTAAPVSVGMTTCTFGQTKAFVNFDGNHYIFTFSNQTYSAWSNGGSPSTNGYSAWYKAVSSKLGQHYWSYGDNILKISDSTNNTLSQFSKVVTSASEENGEMGQNWGYFLGNYNGQQNNQTVKISYTADTATNLGAASMPKGHFGMSSAACSSAAATITIANPL